MTRRGWFRLPGQDGDREVADQMRGLAPALAEAKGKTVLDLGCAEGAISLAFAKAGARQVLGLEIVDEHLGVARRICKGQPCEFRCVDLNNVALGVTDSYDVVLMLAVIHKLKEPTRALGLFAGAASDLVVVRMPAFAYGQPPALFRSERYGRELVDVARVMSSRGFVLERVERGPTEQRGQEPVLYFRRQK